MSKKQNSLALEYGFNVIFCPKYHYELNTIEDSGKLWKCIKVVQAIRMSLKSFLELNRVFSKKILNKTWVPLNACTNETRTINFLEYLSLSISLNARRNP
ncbi:hypothetical protein BpHYR1_038707 [Brachionus plicatilis]|uniref:Uncharacterized protein n=1 Tax=Brachionus plicatilis TaxID=10195 RepID=A0A3M7S9Y4_BRAPC|nr:hypothetical protein BpHYR1_038707 [Brachionus plicatilis]